MSIHISKHIATKSTTTDQTQSKALEDVGKKDSMEKLMKCWKDVERLLFFLSSLALKKIA